MQSSLKILWLKNKNTLNTLMPGGNKMLDILQKNLQLKTAELCKYVWPWHDFLLPSGIKDQKKKLNILQI